MARPAMPVGSSAASGPGARGSRAAALARALCLAALLFGGATLSEGQGGKGEEALVLQRLVVPPERVAAELEKVQQGTLVKLPRTEFEARVERAARALEA